MARRSASSCWKRASRAFSATWAMAGPGPSRCSTASSAGRARTRSCCAVPTGCCRISSPRRRIWCGSGPRRSPPIAAFLSLFQRELAAAVGVPVATSSLMQVPWVQATLPPGQRVGVVTVSAGSLTPAHLEKVGVPVDTPVAGTEGGREFFRVLIKAEKDDMDVDLARQDVVDARWIWWRGIRRWAPSCSNARTCRPMPRPCRRRRAAGPRHLLDDQLVPCRLAAAGVLTGTRRGDSGTDLSPGLQGA